MSDFVSESQFYMWRTLFAVAHADSIVADEEVAFMASVLNDINFTPEQTEVLKDDITITPMPVHFPAAARLLTEFILRNAKSLRPMPPLK